MANGWIGKYSQDILGALGGPWNFRVLQGCWADGMGSTAAPPSPRGKVVKYFPAGRTSQAAVAQLHIDKDGWTVPSPRVTTE